VGVFGCGNRCSCVRLPAPTPCPLNGLTAAPRHGLVRTDGRYTPLTQSRVPNHLGSILAAAFPRSSLEYQSRLERRAFRARAARDAPVGISG
jgi:hypothetical protein